MTTAEIITIGTEIVLGQIVNTNAQYISKILTERGIQVLFQTSIGDDKESLKSVLKIAKNRVMLIITTGGLGPTANDITREAVSDFFGIPLVSNKETYDRIQKFFRDQHGDISNECKKQAFIPNGALAIPNDNGMATGFVLRQGDIDIVCLPGVPREMHSMLNKYLEIYALQYKPDGICTLTRNLHTFGTSERTVEDILKSYVAQQIAANMKEEKIRTMTLVHDGIVTVNILASAKGGEDALKLLDRAEQGIRKELGHAVFGVDDMGLEHAVAGFLKKSNKTIAVAESCTGGLLSDKLTNIPGISEFFLEGVVAYSNEAKIDILRVPEELILKYGAVSSHVAKSMAEGIKKRSSANIGVGITGIAGPTGGTKEKPVGLVYISVVVDDITEVKECRFRGSRLDIKNIAVNTALNMICLKLMNNCC